jgi:hypothetical protein
MVLEVEHEELSELIECYYNAKLPLDVSGTFGIGKSQSVREKAMDLAAKKSKEFINWNECTFEKKQEVFNNPKKYFVFLDIRLSEFDASDIKGLPELSASDKLFGWLVWRVPFFAKLMEKPEGDGILFFDERNLAPPLVQSSCYKIVHDRIINDSKVGENWLIMSAGNTDEDRAYIHETAPPLRDRCGEVKLMTPSGQKWIDKYAIPRGIDPLIIGFISFKTGSLYKVDFNDKQKYTTPRGWERISKLKQKNQIGKDYNKLNLIAKSAISEGIAQEFVAFCKISEQIKLPEIIANPKKLKDIKEINVKWFINTALAEQYKDKKVKFEKIVEFSRVMDSNEDVELVAYLWKLCSGLSKAFKKDFVDKLEQDDELVTKYARYLC